MKITSKKLQKQQRKTCFFKLLSFFLPFFLFFVFYSGGGVGSFSRQGFSV